MTAARGRWRCLGWNICSLHIHSKVLEELSSSIDTRSSSFSFSACSSQSYSTMWNLPSSSSCENAQKFWNLPQQPLSSLSTFDIIFPSSSPFVLRRLKATREKEKASFLLLDDTFDSRLKFNFHFPHIRRGVEQVKLKTNEEFELNFSIIPNVRFREDCSRVSKGRKCSAKWKRNGTKKNQQKRNFGKFTFLFHV